MFDTRYTRLIFIAFGAQRNSTRLVLVFRIHLMPQVVQERMFFACMSLFIIGAILDPPLVCHCLPVPTLAFYALNTLSIYIHLHAIFDPLDENRTSGFHINYRTYYNRLRILLRIYIGTNLTCEVGARAKPARSR